MAGDSGAGNDFQVLAGEFERRHDADIGLACRQAVGAGRGNLEIQIEEAALGTVKHPPNQRRGVQEADRGDPQAVGNNRVGQPSVYRGERRPDATDAP